MIKNLLYLFSLTICIQLSCKKNNQDYFGEANVLMNGGSYLNQIVSRKINGQFSFALVQYEKVNGILIERRSLSFAQFNLSKDSQVLVLDSIRPKCLFTTSQDDGDVAGDFFIIDSNAKTNNYFKINKQENNFNEIWGEFNVALVRKKNCYCTDLPDLINFTNGSFHVIFKD